MKPVVIAVAAAFLAGTALFASDESFPVDASNPAWQNSGVQVKAGQHVEVDADAKETWNTGWGDTNAAGYGFQLNASAGLPQYHAGPANKDWHWAALICAVGKDRKEAQDPQNEVEIGLKRGFTVDHDGSLYFLCNDNANAPAGAHGYAGNTGIIHVTISVGDETAATTGSGATYDAQADFSGSKNPNGVWSYGWTEGLAGKLHIYPGTYLKYSGTYWEDESIENSLAPMLGYHPIYVDEASFIPEKTLLIHPGPQREFSQCVWTAPKGGTYDIQASFTSLDIGNPHAYVLKNGQTLGDSQLTRHSPWTQGFKQVRVAAGDTIAAVAGVGASGIFYNDVTQFSLTITPARPVPPDKELVAAVAQQLQGPIKDMVQEAVEAALKERGLDPAASPAPKAGKPQLTGTTAAPGKPAESGTKN